MELSRLYQTTQVVRPIASREQYATSRVTIIHQQHSKVYSYSGYFVFTIRYKQCIYIAGNSRGETIQGILFEIFSMEYRIEIDRILISMSNIFIIHELQSQRQTIYNKRGLISL